MENLLFNILDIFSTSYIFSVIVGTYLCIKMIDYFRKTKVVPVWARRVITLVVGIILFLVFRWFIGESVDTLVASYLAAIVLYDTAIKRILIFFKIDYRESTRTTNPVTNTRR